MQGFWPQRRETLYSSRPNERGGAAEEWTFVGGLSNLVSIESIFRQADPVTVDPVDMNTAAAEPPLQQHKMQIDFL